MRTVRNARGQNLPLSRAVRFGNGRIRAQFIAKEALLRHLGVIRRDDMDMQPELRAVVADRADSHRPVVTEGVRPHLALEAE